jgi:hypothetical protein
MADDWTPIQRITVRANALSLRYCGSPVYLVGSALEDTDPRDIDIVVVMTDKLFWAAYGFPDGTIDEWIHGDMQENPPRIWRRWARDCMKQSILLTEWMGGPIVDFKTQPQTWSEKQHVGKRRKQLSIDLKAKDVRGVTPPVSKVQSTSTKRKRKKEHD